MLSAVSSLAQRSGVWGALTSVTDSSDLSFVATKDAFPKRRVQQLEDDLVAAMENERYEDANAVKKELQLLLSPSQAFQREAEEWQEKSMRVQQEAVMNRPGSSLFSEIGNLASQAVKSWRSISGAELTFVATSSHRRHSTEDGGQISEEDAMNEGGQTASKLHNNMQKLHMKLGAVPPDVEGACACAMEMIELVGDAEGQDGDPSEVDVELVDSCVEKVLRTAVRELGRVEERGKTAGWLIAVQESMPVFCVVMDLGGVDEAWAALEDTIALGLKAVGQEASMISGGGSKEGGMAVAGHVTAIEAALSAGCKVVASMQRVQMAEEARQMVAKKVGELASAVALESLQQFKAATKVEEAAASKETALFEDSAAMAALLARILKALEDFNDKLAEASGGGSEESFLSDALSEAVGPIVEAYDLLPSSSS